MCFKLIYVQLVLNILQYWDWESENLISEDFTY